MDAELRDMTSRRHPICFDHEIDASAAWAGLLPEDEPRLLK